MFVFVIWVEVHGSDVPGFLVPLAVVVVGHDCDPVQISVQCRHIVTWVRGIVIRCRMDRETS